MANYIDPDTTACFTGHRDLAHPELPIRNKVRAEIMRLVEDGVITFITGGAVGFDMLAGEEVLKLQEEYPDIELIVAVPFPGQDERYSPSDKSRYAALLEGAAEVRTISRNPGSRAYYLRNDFMVDNSSAVIAYLAPGRKGGTQYTYDRAVAEGHDAVNIY